MRPVFTLLHRWVGLAIAGFLFISGLTGAVISWDHELDGWLNPHLHQAVAQGPALPALALADRAEERDKRAWATYIPLAVTPGETLSLLMQPRVDPTTGQVYELGYNQVFLDPATGDELGRREWGQAWPITTETLISFLYKLHYSLHVPEMWGIDEWGLWLMGGVALLWTLDCFVGFYLTLPVAVQRRRGRGWWARWAPAWRIKTSGSTYRINFDIHRAFSLWTWVLLLTLAFTGFSLNLYREVFYPVMSMVSKVTPTPYDSRTPRDKHDPIVPTLGFAPALERAQAEAQRRGWAEPVGAIAYSPRFGLYSARFFHPGDDHGAAGVGPAQLYIDGASGAVLGAQEPWKGTVADIFMQAQFPLHSGRILGLPGRIMISVMGLVVATLSVTGVVIWWRKRAARSSVRRRTAATAATGLPGPHPAE